MKEITNPRLARNFIGDQENLNQLDSFIRSGNIPQSLIFCGPKGVGKSNSAYIFAKKLLSQGKESSNDDSLFDMFGSSDDKNKISINEETANRVEKSTHSDLLIIELDYEEDKKSIPVDKVKEIGKFLSLTPADAKYRVAIIDSVDDLNISSSNAILKITEEPNRNAILILISHKISSLLPTIRSRCFELFFKVPTEKEFLEIINKFGVEYDKKIAEFSGYSPGVYLEMINRDSKIISDFVNFIIEKDNIPTSQASSFSSIIKGDKSGNIYNIFKNIILFNFHKKVRDNLNSSNRESINNNIKNFDNVVSILDNHERRNMDFNDTLKEILFKIS